MKDCLRLTLAQDDDGTAELFAEVVANGFSGRGSAWFNLSDLAGFADTLSRTFPLQNAVELKGGYWHKDGSGLSQEHLALSFYPVGSRGTLGCQVRLATPIQEHDSPDERHSLRVELATYYQELQQFAKDLLGLANGAVREAVLFGAAA